VRGGAQAEFGQAGAEPLDVALHHRAEIRVHHHGREPLELAELRRDFVARADEGLGQFLLQNAFRRLLVFGAHEAVEERDRDRGDAGRAKLLRGCAHGCFVERRLDRAGVPYALGHFDAQVARDERRRLVGEKIVEVGPLLPADFQKIAKARGGHETGLDAAMLDQRVGRDRGAVAEI
jgi:hypothetical protein